MQPHAHTHQYYGYIPQWGILSTLNFSGELEVTAHPTHSPLASDSGHSTLHADSEENLMLPPSLRPPHFPSLSIPVQRYSTESELPPIATTPVGVVSMATSPPVGTPGAFPISLVHHCRYIGKINVDCTLTGTTNTRKMRTLSVCISFLAQYNPIHSDCSDTCPKGRSL